MRIVFMGTPEFAVTPLQCLLRNGFEVAAVYSQPDREAGRGRMLASPPVKIAAQNAGIPIYQPEKLRSAEEINHLASLKPDVIVVAAYGQILKEAILNLPPYGCLNIHPSLLPQYRGVSPVTATIRNGDEFSGVSIMQLDKGVDTGPVLGQVKVRLADWDTTGTLTEKLSSIGGQLLIELLPRLIAGKLVPTPQDGKLASYTKKLEKADGEINWSKPAVEIWRQVRACQPWPGAFTHWQAKQLKIIEAVVLPGESTTHGRVVSLPGKPHLAIETAAGILGLAQVQMEGKRVMTGEEFLRGQQQIIGCSLLE
ncbi:MAG TPA: methionyl-tRNA formyltransferase [Dehalococcoidales bacterium]|nr:methionyl-tRNA formyltransferase [Dehalococcoidales bacterium]